MSADVRVATPAGDVRLKSADEVTIADELRLNRLPPTMFQAYLVGRDGTRTPVPIDTPLASADEMGHLEIQCIRNTDFRKVLPQHHDRRTVANPVVSITDLLIGEAPARQVDYELDAEQAQAVVADRVGEFMNQHHRASGFVAGISGGGDSNTLVKSLEEFVSQRQPGTKRIYFTLVFDPVWPVSAAERAKELCERHGVHHQVIDARDAAALLEMKGSLEAFHDSFMKQVGGNAAHFFGTFMVSRAARALCREFHLNDYCLGFNREDILAEFVFRLINGVRPLGFPVREFGKFRLLMPLWEVPKAVLDACYPVYSLRNYQERFDTTYQRSIAYYLAHSIEDVYSNLGLSMLKGARKLFDGEWERLEHREDLDVYPLQEADPEALKMAGDLIRAHFQTPAPGGVAPSSAR